MVLLRLLEERAPRLRLKLHVAHLHHGLRGRQADMDEALVRDYCRARHIPFMSGKIDVRALAAAKGLSLEAAAREARYSFLRRCARKAGATAIALGHTADDQVETFLMRLLRGAGVRGLRGILPVRTEGDLYLVRPLLCVWRPEIVALAEERGLAYRTDRSNLSLDCTRNRVRRRLIPYLQKNYNPGIKEVAWRCAEILAAAQAFMEDAARKRFAAIARVNRSRVEFPIRRFLASPRALGGGMLRLAARSLGKEGDFSYRDLCDVYALCMTRGGRRVRYLPGGLMATVEQKRLLVTPVKRLKPRGYEFPVVDGTDILCAPFPVRFGMRALPAGRVRMFGRRAARLADVWGDEGQRRWPLVECISGDALEGRALTARSRRPGDRYRPLGMQGEKKIKAIMIDEKLPLSLRESVPVICSGGEIVWLPGYRIADRFKITPRTRRVLMLTVEKI